MSQPVDLRPVIRAVENVGVELAHGINRVDARVGQVAQDLSLTSSELRELRQEFDLFVQQAARVAVVQQSETRVVNLKAQLDREFGHYAVVRRTSVGLLQAFDVGNVSKGVTGQISEELMLQTPRYWLAPALVTLAAWANDDEEIAQKSVREAYSRDPSKTSLLFAIVLRRQGRRDASARWLKHYLDAQDPTALGREFVVILEATSYNAFGPAAQQQMSERLSGWLSDLRQNQAIVQQQVARWADEIAAQSEKVAAEAYPDLALLGRHRDWPRLQRQMEAASGLAGMIEKYSAIAQADASMPNALEDLMDDLVDQLVTEYDREELPLRREVVYHETVIGEQGDVDVAQARAARLQEALDDTFDAVSLQTSTAITPELLGASVQTQRVAVGAGVSDLRDAVGRYAATYRQQALWDMQLDFDGEHSEYARVFQFPGLSLTTATPEPQAIQQLSELWRQTMARAIDVASFKYSWYVPRFLVIAVIVWVLYAINPVIGIAGALIGGGIVWFRGVIKKKQSDDEVANIEAQRQAATDVSVAMYRNATAQFVDAMELYRNLDSHEPELLRLVDTWPTRKADEEEDAS